MFFSKKLREFKEIKHCFFSKKGGFSKGIYKSLNCGQGSRDKKIHVQKNLNLVLKKIDINSKLALMYQTHSNKVIVIDKKNKNLKKFKSDAIITKQKGICLGVVTADCVPIILYDMQNQIIGCIHAGWKGAVNGIIENTIMKFKKLNNNNNIIAAVGPCIGFRSYEVDIKFYKNFISKSKKNKVYFADKNKNKKIFNLRKYVNNKLRQLNIKVENINFDTFKQKNRFFSYRRSQKLGEIDYGRCISVVTLSKFSQI